MAQGDSALMDVASNPVVHTNTLPTDQSGEARSYMWLFEEGYAHQPSLSSSDLCRCSEKFRQWRY